MNCNDCCYNLPKGGYSYCTYEDGECIKISMLEKENAGLKELIKNIIRVTWGEGWNYSLDWKVKAEQFLNDEVEK